MVTETAELGPYQRNQIYPGECADMMSRLPDGCIDLTVTSPPYDNLRDYNGFTLDWQAVIKQLYRVTKPGGVVVWVVADQTVNGSETGTSFRQALWAMECGFSVETMIYESSAGASGSNNLYWQSFEFMFIFVKGERPKGGNLLRDKKNIHAGRGTSGERRAINGNVKNGTARQIKDYSKRTNIWRYVGGDHTDLGHPAIFPEALARDHIISWSNPGDLVLDPFMGSGTTAKMAMQNGRDYLGFDISPEYVELARKRVAWANPPLLVVS